MKKKRSASKKKRSRIQIPSCSHFNGYKPCFPGTNCLEECVEPRPIGTRILIVNLEAMGNVLVTTTLLHAIKRKYPASTISWVTLRNAYRLLDNNPMIDRVFVWEPESWMKIRGMEFDVAMNFDKSVHAGAFIMSLNAKKKLGYGINGNGAIIPLTKEAEYNYRLGLDDHLKFRVNTMPNTQLLCEAVGLTYRRDEYILRLSKEEESFCTEYRKQHGLDSSTLVIGLNTGCSLLYPNKKMTVDQHIVLIKRLSGLPGTRIVLLGGPEDTERNAEIVREAGDKVLATPTTEGLRRGICYENVCDVVISGDSFGMHVAIGLKKYVIVWFGVSCPQEIDLFGRGVKLIPEGLECSPCWKKACPYNLECIQMIDLERIVEDVRRFHGQFQHQAAG